MSAGCIGGNICEDMLSKITSPTLIGFISKITFDRRVVISTVGINLKSNLTPRVSTPINMATEARPPTTSCLILDLLNYSYSLFPRRFCTRCATPPSGGPTCASSPAAGGRGRRGRRTDTTTVEVVKNRDSAREHNILRSADFSLQEVAWKNLASASKAIRRRHSRNLLYRKMNRWVHVSMKFRCRIKFRQRYCQQYQQLAWNCEERQNFCVSISNTQSSCSTSIWKYL